MSVTVESDPAPFVTGDRVRIADTYHWRCGVQGTIGPPPRSVRQVSSTRWEGSLRVVERPDVPLVLYWVVFDEWNWDREGNGPYEGAEIDSRFLGFA